MNRILTAALYAAERHSRQRRDNADATPYINHPLEVAQLLVDVADMTDENILVAALLHDTIEDTCTKPSEISSAFGPVVLGYVVEVTDDQSLPEPERRRLQIEHAGSLSKGAKLIKLADKIANLRSVAFDPPKDWPMSRRKEYFVWALELFKALRGTNVNLDARFLNVHQEGLLKLQQ